MTEHCGSIQGNRFRFGLPYRVINVASGDLGSAAAKYDLEVWLPSEGAYREVTSCSKYTDYSARRMSSRYRDENGTGLLHTLNGTACAISRTLVFLMENGQQSDGSITDSDALQSCRIRFCAGCG